LRRGREPGARNRLPAPSKSHLGVMLASLAAGSAATVTALDSWDKILVDFGFKKSESAALAKKGEQGELLRQMVRLISNRVFWTVRYSGEVADGFPKEDQDEAWKRYNESVVAYNENYMLNWMLTAKYFNAESSAKLQELNALLLRVNTCLNKIRYPQLYRDKDRSRDKDPACHFQHADGGGEADNLRVLADARSQIYTKVGELAALLSK
jgi:hypothetical protein